MEKQNYDTFDVPAVGELRARPGTAVHEMAGAVKYWHDKAKTAHVDGFVAGGFVVVFAELLGYSIYYVIRNLL